jgi:hypothetical protein
VQKKVIKENHTPLPLFPAVLAPHLGVGCGTRFAQTVLAAYHLPLKPKARQGGIIQLRVLINFKNNWHMVTK